MFKKIFTKKGIIILGLILILIISISILLFIKVDKKNNNSKKENETKIEKKKSKKEGDTSEDYNESDNTEDSDEQDETLLETSSQNVKEVSESVEKKQTKKKSTDSSSDDSSSSVKENLTITVKPESTTNDNKYKCASDYTLEGTMCYKYIKPRIEYECPFGAKKSGAYCIIDTSTNANVEYSCPNNYTLSGDKCLKEKIVNTYNPADYENLSETSKSSIYNTFQANCNNGTIRYEGKIAYCYETEVIYATATYSCPQGSGELAGDKCISAETEEAFAKYYCDKGNFDAINKMCKITKKAEEK